MADLSDVEAALVNTIAAAAYPDGNTNPSAAHGIPIHATRGWPTPEDLADYMKAGMAIVSVFAKPGVSTNTTRFNTEWQDGVQVKITMTATVSCNTTGHDLATFSGVANDGLCAGVRHAGKAYSVRMIAGETADLAASRLAALVPGASALGTVLMVPRSVGFAVRTAVPRMARREMRRVKQSFTLSTWCSTPEDRDTVATLVDSCLGFLDWLPLNDGTGGRISFISQGVIDTTQDAGTYRRDLEVSVEYALYDQRLLPVVMFGTVVTRPAFVHAA